MTAEDEREPVGSVAEEAVKLLGALQDWAKESAGDRAHSADGACGGARSLLASVDEHIATGGSECRLCPVCRVISLVRETSPEVKSHLASAATSLAHAVASAMATPSPDQNAPSRPDTKVERIDLSDGEDWEDD